MNKHNFKTGKIERCQICFSTKLNKVIELGYQPLANSLLKDLKEENTNEKFPINIVRCDDCTLLQIDFIVDQNKVYHLNYPYLPGITKTVDNEQKELSDFLFQQLNLNSDNLVVDIGSNDGSLLKHFKKKGIKTIGVEPTNIAKIANNNGIETIQSFFNKIISQKIVENNQKAKVITCTNVFAHMSTLGDVMDGIVNLLDEEGVFCFENHYIMEIIKKVQYDTFYHEHLRTYSLISLTKLFEIYNLNLYDAQIVSRYGGSIRCLVSKQKKIKTQRLKDLLNEENQTLIKDADSTYEKFVSDIKRSKKELINKILDLKKANKTIIAKSCPARAVVLLNYCGLNNNHLSYIAEQPSSLKLNLYVPGSNLKIVSDDILLEDQPDYILLLAWHLSEPIIKKWRERGLKSKFIVPLPNLQIYE